ncbi:hypothetical protein Tco_1148939, partial [Tanacetum coccineum]
MLPVTQIDTFYNGLTLRHSDTINAAVGGTFMKRRPEECYDLIENMTAHHNDWDTSAQRNESSSFTTSSNPEIASLKLEMVEINKSLMKMLQTNQQVNSVTSSCETCGGSHSYNNCLATVGQTQNVYDAGAYNQGGNSYQPQGNQNMKKVLMERPQGVLPSNTVPNLREDIKVITTRSGINLAGPSIPPLPPSSSSKEVERDPETLTDPVLTESTTRIPPLVVQSSPISSSSELPHALAPASSFVIPERNPHQPPIPYPSRLNKDKLQD